MKNSTDAVLDFCGLIVDPAEIRHLLEGPMLESSTYRYILQQE